MCMDTLVVLWECPGTSPYYQNTFLVLATTGLEPGLSQLCRLQTKFILFLQNNHLLTLPMEQKAMPTSRLPLFSQAWTSSVSRYSYKGLGPTPSGGATWFWSKTRLQMLKQQHRCWKIVFPSVMRCNYKWRCRLYLFFRVGAGLAVNSRLCCWWAQQDVVGLNRVAEILDVGGKLRVNLPLKKQTNKNIYCTIWEYFHLYNFFWG